MLKKVYLRIQAGLWLGAMPYACPLQKLASHALNIWKKKEMFEGYAPLGCSEFVPILVVIAAKHNL